MQAQAGIAGQAEEWSFLIEPEPGVSLWQALADANPQGFTRIHIGPDMTARVYVYERGA